MLGRRFSLGLTVKALISSCADATGGLREAVGAWQEDRQGHLEGAFSGALMTFHCSARNVNSSEGSQDHKGSRFGELGVLGGKGSAAPCTEFGSWGGRTTATPFCTKHQAVVRDPHLSCLRLAIEIRRITSIYANCRKRLA